MFISPLEVATRFVLYEFFGLGLFGVVFAVNSSIHSYLVLAYTDNDKVALHVGFYYMANAGGRLLEAVASGLLYQGFGLARCLWGAVSCLALAWLISFRLPRASAGILLAPTE